MLRSSVVATAIILFLCASCSSSSGGDAASTSGPGAGGAGGGGNLGSPCTNGADCASAVCLETGICSGPCDVVADCPAGSQWTCAPLPPHGDVCQCTASGAETCDGADEDCNGVVDDGAICPNGGTCQDGACVCPPDKTCDGACVDLATDSSHCGACDVTCPPNAACVASKCACDGGQTACGGSCVDTATDPAHCGDCDTACPNGTPCAGGQCQCAGTACGGRCVDIQNDPDNCGACNHGCLGGGCASGACLAVTVDPDPTHGAWFAATDATSVYFTLDQPILMKASLDGSNLQVLGTGGYALRSVAVDATDVFIADLAGSVFKCPKGGGPFTTIASTFAPFSIGLDATHVYWGDEQGYVSRADKDGGNLLQIETGQGVYGLVVDATHVYWSEAFTGEIRRADLDLTNVTTLVTGQTDVLPLVSDGTNLYWASYSSAGIFSADKAGGPVKMVSSQANLWGLAADASGVYWTAFNKIGRTDVANMSDTILAPAGEAKGIALTGDRVFWCDQDAPTLAFVAK